MGVLLYHEPGASVRLSALPEYRPPSSTLRSSIEHHSSMKRTRFIKNMNHTDIPEILLLGLTDDPGMQPFLFGLFLSMYLVTILGNLIIILAVSSDPHLHTPMNYFLCILSFTDIWISTTTAPQMLVNINRENQHISYIGCIAHIGFVLFFVGFENCVLAAMAYNRYVAICHPLRYTAIMTPQPCAMLILLCLLLSTGDALLHSLLVLRLSFCTNREIPHFFCELAQVIKLACSDTLINNFLMSFVGSLFSGVPVSGIIFSYIQILFSILRMPSVEGKCKAFSTCGSHVSVVSLFYGTGFGVYISSAVTDSSRKSAVASVMYIMIPQMMNPFIYSLRNRDMKGDLRKIITRIHLSLMHSPALGLFFFYEPK
ncbi:olfactory receptor 7G2-like [Manis pentadactyla]|uniref:olfactory receptor 7G2-like n=1 Tax=Manis pentadactyla TaxID=143292 RepID=UPI00255CD57C|nr:olfactory receptor 7G2-like [Manis pentadactyla]